MRFHYNVPKPSPLLKNIKLAPVIYLDNHCSIDCDVDNMLVIEDGEGKQEFYFREELAAIIACDPIDIKSGALSALLANQISVSIFNQNGNFVGRIQPNYKYNHSIIEAQLSITDSQRIHLLKQTAWSQMRNCRRYLLRTRPEYRNNKEFLLKYDLLINYVDTKNSIPSLQGLLACGMSIYRQELQHCVNWSFDKNTHVLFNLMVKHVYKLLNEIITIAILSIGLDPSISFWHKSNRRLGLVEDILTQFKIYGDAVVISAINKGQIALKDFDDWNEADRLLPPRVIKILQRAFEQKMKGKFQYPHLDFSCSYQEAIYVQVQQYSLYLLHEIDNYYCIELR